MPRRGRHALAPTRCTPAHSYPSRLALTERAEPECGLVRRVSATPRVFRSDRRRVSPRRWTLCALAHRGAPDASTSRRSGGAPIPHDTSAQLPMSRPVSTDGRRRAGRTGTSAGRDTRGRSDHGTPRRDVARDSRRTGTLHQLFRAGLRIGGQDPRGPPAYCPITRSECVGTLSNNIDREVWPRLSEWNTFGRLA